MEGCVMEKLVKINNKWVKESELFTAEAVASFYKSLIKVKEEQKQDIIKVKEVEHCKTYDEIVHEFDGDEEIQVNELSPKYKEYILQKESMGSLRYVLGWKLYQEWIKETITGH